jgi:hypothetical protein
MKRSKQNNNNNNKVEAEKEANNKQLLYTVEEQEAIFNRAKQLSYKLRDVTKDVIKELELELDRQGGIPTLYMALEIYQNQLQDTIKKTIGEEQARGYMNRLDNFVKLMEEVDADMEAEAKATATAKGNEEKGFKNNDEP